MWRKPRTSFGIRRDGIPILDFDAPPLINLNISAQTPFNLPGNVPMYEEHSVRHKAGYTLSEWYSLDPYERAIEVALERIDNMIEYMQNKAISSKRK